MKFFIFGVSLNNNLGGPSIFYGIDIILSELYPNSTAVYCEFSNQIPSNLQKTKIITGIKCLDSFTPKTRGILIIKALLYKIFRLKKIIENEILVDLIGADVIINARGIDFSDTLSGKRNHFNLVKFVVFHHYEFIAKLFNKKVVSFTKSIGPVLTKVTQKELSLYMHHYCDYLICRENKSKEELEKIGNFQNVSVNLDSGLLMPSTNSNYSSRVHKSVIISVSYQIIRQWKNSVSYIDQIASLITYILDKYDFEVILLPNETQTISYNDINVAHDIKHYFESNDRVKICDFDNFTPYEIKGIIANSEVLVGSRYHSIVAALSTCTPVLAIGWHYKYFELLNAFGQADYLLSNKESDSQLLINLFEILLANITDIRNELSLKNRSLKKNIIESISPLHQYISNF